MTVALSILFAAIVGGVVFMLIDRAQRGPKATAEPTPEVWTPATPPRPAPSTSLFVPGANAPAPFRERYEKPTLILPGEEHTEPLPPSRGLWEDPPRRGEDDEDEPPRGLWSGWAR